MYIKYNFARIYMSLIIIYWLDYNEKQKQSKNNDCIHVDIFVHINIDKSDLMISSSIAILSHQILDFLRFGNLKWCF